MGVVDSNMVVENDSRRKPFLLRDHPDLLDVVSKRRPWTCLRRPWQVE
jgi:hypothetical protein